VIGTFVFGWPSIIAVVINYLKRGEARGTWLESHFSWQIRTFWFALLWTCIVAVLGALLVIVLVGFAIWAIGLFVLGIWAIYRIARGWMRLQNRLAVTLGGSGVPMFGGAGVPGFWGSGVQGFRGSWVQGFRGSGVRGTSEL
jgi:uncharacterized membrane protein